MKEFARKQMGTKKVLLDVGLNAAIWGKGIKNVPHRIRVRLSRRRNDDEDAPKVRDAARPERVIVALTSGRTPRAGREAVRSCFLCPHKGVQGTPDHRTLPQASLSRQLAHSR